MMPLQYLVSFLVRELLAAMASKIVMKYSLAISEDDYDEDGNGDDDGNGDHEDFHDDHLSNTVPVLVQADILLVKDLKNVVIVNHSQ